MGAARKRLYHFKKRIVPSFTRIYPKSVKVSAQYARDHFPEILTAASSGEEVEISPPGQPALILFHQSTPAPCKRTTPRILGEGIGEMGVPEWDEWKAIDREL